MKKWVEEMKASMHIKLHDVRSICAHLDFNHLICIIALLTFSLESSLSPHLVNDRNCLDTILYILRAFFNSSTASSNLRNQCSLSKQAIPMKIIERILSDHKISQYNPSSLNYVSTRYLAWTDWPMSNCVLNNPKKKTSSVAPIQLWTLGTLCLSQKKYHGSVI